MKLNNLKDLGNLKQDIFKAGLSDDAKRNLESLENLISEFAQVEGIFNLPDVSPKDIALAFHESKLGRVDRINGLMSDYWPSSGKLIHEYVFEYNQHLSTNNYYWNECLGFFLIASHLYRQVSNREKTFLEIRNRKNKKLNIILNDAENEIADHEKRLSIKAVNFLKKFGPTNSLVDYFTGKGFLGFTDEYNNLINHRVFIKSRASWGENRIKYWRDGYFNPIKKHLAGAISDIVKEIDNNGSRNINLSRALRKRVVDLKKETIDLIVNDNKFSLFSHDIYRYCLTLDDNSPEKLALLEKGLLYLEKHKSPDPISLSLFGLNIFISKYIIRHEIDFDSLKRFYSDFRRSVDLLEKGNVERDTQLLAHILCTNLNNLNTFVSRDLLDYDRGKLKEYCSANGISFRNLSSKLNNFALNSNYIPEKYKRQYRTIFGFEGI